MMLINEKEWLTLKEASRLTGKSIAVMKTLVHRKKNVNIKKIQDNGRNYWVIHKDYLSAKYDCSKVDILCNDKSAGAQFAFSDYRMNSDMTESCSAMIPLEYHERRIRELESDRDRLIQALMAYRFKYEELESKFRLLPANAELLPFEIKQKEIKLEELEREQIQKEEVILQAQEIIKQSQIKLECYESSMARLQQKLKEEETAKEIVMQAYRIEFELSQAEMKKPLWRKILSQFINCFKK